MNKLITHIKVWNLWRKKSTNSWGYKLLVLLGLANSPTFVVDKVFYNLNKSLCIMSESTKRATEKLCEFSALVKEKENG
ncbi:MAG: hypothetical protein IKY27_00290 [Bacteroidales bacterium]|nr:hypothetical protein [Bacteroidales bacterium]